MKNKNNKDKIFYKVPRACIHEPLGILLSLQNSAGETVPLKNSSERVVFTKEMKKDYTILIPTMLDIHFQLFVEVMKKRGYKVELLKDEEENKDVADTGLRYVHNDACYPVILVTGQLIGALQSGKYDVDKTALMITQTGGGCRASNYISLLRKALMKAGFPQVPVISLNFAGLESNPGFKITPAMGNELINALIIGDLIMLLRNQCLVYEKRKGETDEVVALWLKKLPKILNKPPIPPVPGMFYPYISEPANRFGLKKIMNDIINDFAKIKRMEKKAVKVGIVGEIYVKYSPLGNNRLEEFLCNEGAEVVVPGLLDFILYCIYNNIYDNEIYGFNKNTLPFWKMAKAYLLGKKNDMINAINAEGSFEPPASFDYVASLPERDDCVGTGMKMEEGWLLTAEMLELCETGVMNIVCTQPFGCLPNHIVGKGMMLPIKERHPEVNIVAIDYDPGASKINQENRLKLMLANAEMKLEEEKEKSISGGS